MSRGDSPATGQPVMSATAIDYRIAREPWEFEAIHRLNHQTFTGEIPQHPPNPDGRLVDRFHDTNVYLIAARGDFLAGMLAARFEPPFSLARKLPELDRHLPPGHHWCELRLLAVAPELRGSPVLRGLVRLLLATAAARGTDAAMISAAAAKVPLYRKLGFTEFGPLVGHEDSWFQPMHVTRQSFVRAMRHRPRPGFVPLPAPPAVGFLPPMSAAGEESATSPPAAAAPSDTLESIHADLLRMTGAASLAFVPGAPLLGHDLACAQLLLREETGMVISYGPSGEALADHARRLWLPHEHLRLPWQRPLEPSKLAALLDRHPEVRWLWTTHCEPATGALTDLDALQSLCRARDLRLAIDASATLGHVPVNLSDVWLATTDSGSLGATPGLLMVFHQDHIQPAPDRLARSLDLGAWRAASIARHHVPAGLNETIRTATVHLHSWDRREAIRQFRRHLLERLQFHGLTPAIDPARSGPHILTLRLPAHLAASTLLPRLASLGILASSPSLHGGQFLRFWIPGSLMDEEAERTLDALSSPRLWRTSPAAT
jgi:aspartate aminotransferase-like enzyme/ribosomal protein S18 acetylase RimI-like enzyme